MQALLTHGSITKALTATAPRKTASSWRVARLPARTLVVQAHAKLERNTSYKQSCSIAHPDGYQAYCNVIKGSTRDDGSEGFQFVVVFLKEDGELETSDYEFYKSEWFSTLEACEKAVEEFDVSQLIPQA